MTIGEERDHFGYDPITDTYKEQDSYPVGKRIGIILVSCIVVLITMYFISYNI